MTELNIAEIAYPSGAIRYRYSRILSEDGTRWVRHGLFVEYSEAGMVLSEGNCENGMEEGLWSSFHPSGIKAAEGHYVAGKEEGCWNFWSSTGHPEAPVTFRDGMEVGE